MMPPAPVNARYHIDPSDPAVMSLYESPCMVTTPELVILPTPDGDEANHTAPSVPSVISSGLPPPAGTGYWVTVPKVVILPMARLLAAANHNAWSVPAAMPHGPAPGTGYSVNTPDVLMRPILLALFSVNQSAPSDPATIRARPAAEVGTVYSAMDPDVVIRAILLLPDSINQTAPSGPAVMPVAPALGVGIEYSVSFPADVIVPILFALCSVNQTAASGPMVILLSPLAAVGTGNCVKLTGCATAGAETLSSRSPNHRPWCA